MHVVALYRYPVKSLGGHLIPSMEPTVRGFVDDRRWMFVDAEGRFVSQRSNVQLARFSAEIDGDTLTFRRYSDGGVVGAVAGARRGTKGAVVVWDDVFQATYLDSPDVKPIATALGIPGARLVYMDSAADRRPLDPRYAKSGDLVSFADGFPYLIANQASLDDLATRLGEESLDMLRFRPNIVVGGLPAWAEDDWVELVLNGHRFRTPKPCARCVMVTHEPKTGKKDLRVLAELSRFRKVGNKVLFGMNACWDGPA